MKNEGNSAKVNGKQPLHTLLAVLGEFRDGHSEPP